MRQLKITKQITNRESKSLGKYLTDIATQEMITAEEEVVLAVRIREGDKVALERLVKANLRFVVSVSKQYQNQGLPLNDLINEGNLGLIKAAQRFDETRGFKFISYAVWWIRQSIIQAISEHSRIVRMPINRVGVVSKILKKSAELEQKNERRPTHQELCSHFDLDEKNIMKMMHIASRHVSADAPLSSESEDFTISNTLMDNGPRPDAGLLRESLQEEVNRAMAVLSPTEQTVITHHYGLCGCPSSSLDEVSIIVNIPKYKVKKLKDKALDKLKNSNITENLKVYL